METLEHLKKMLESDPELYERMLDTTGFSFHFNEIVKLAMQGEDVAPRRRGRWSENRRTRFNEKNPLVPDGPKAIPER